MLVVREVVGELGGDGEVSVCLTVVVVALAVDRQETFGCGRAGITRRVLVLENRFYQETARDPTRKPETDRSGTSRPEIVHWLVEAALLAVCLASLLPLLQQRQRRALKRQDGISLPTL